MERASSRLKPRAREPEPLAGSKAHGWAVPLPRGMPLKPEARLLPVPREPALSSIDEVNPIYYNKSQLPLPHPSPHPDQQPSRPSPFSGGRGATPCQQPAGLGLRATEVGSAATPGRCPLWGRCTPQTACRTAGMHAPQTLPGLWWNLQTQRRGRQTGDQQGAL